MRRATVEASGGIFPYLCYVQQSVLNVLHTLAALTITFPTNTCKIQEFLVKRNSVLKR